MSEPEADKQDIAEMERTATQKAGERARAARWDLDVAVFLFAILIMIIILLFQGIGMAIVAPVAFFGLSITWFVGWRKGRQLYNSFYDEELLRLKRELENVIKETKDAKIEKVIEETKDAKIEKVIEETIDEKVEKYLRERLK